MPEPKDYIRVVRVVEYVGDRATVEHQIKRALHGEKVVDIRGYGPMLIKATTLNEFPDVLDELERIGFDQKHSDMPNRNAKSTSKYCFASLRRGNFEIEGTDPENAWKNLVEREKDKNTLWRCYDANWNKQAVCHRGFSLLVENDFSSPAYRKLTG